MKYIKTSLLLTLILTLRCSAAFSSGGVVIRAFSPVVPLLKNIEHNQLMRVSISIPAGAKNVYIDAIHASLASKTSGLIERLDLWSTQSEPLFAPTGKLLSITPENGRFEIPVNLDLAPGLHYLWLSCKLTETADIDALLDLKVSDIEGKGIKYNVIQPENQQPKRLGIAVKKARENGIHTFRIPGLTTTDQGSLIAVYDIRYTGAKDLPANIDVGMSRSSDGGRHWENMKVIMDMGEPHENNGVGDPAVLFDPETKTIWAVALWSKGNKSIAGSKPGLSEDETGQLVIVNSKDDGLTWSNPVSITRHTKPPKWNLFFNGPGSGMVMYDGTLVFAGQYWDENAMPHSTIIYSKDHGNSWHTENGPKANTTESQVIETSDGMLMLNMRDNRGGFRSVATTSDLGKTWIEHHSSYLALKDPVCMASFIKADMLIKGKLKPVVLFGNDNSSTTRHHLTVKASLDLGETWNTKNEVLIDERSLFGYSALARIDDHTIGLFYEGVRDLYFVRIPIKDIVN